MKVRGHRECKDCGTRWSYYDTGSVVCPDCGSMHSVGVDERTRHTDAPATFDLTPVRGRIDEDPLRRVAEDAAERAAEYVRKRGFVDAGDLRPLDETFVAAALVRHVGGEFARGLQHGDAEELYFLSLLRDADGGERPPAEEVPESLWSPHGLGLAAAVEAYQRDLRTYLDDHPDEHARRLSGRVRDHRKRMEALDGDVPPRDAERLLHAVRDVGKYVAEGDESALVTADNWLEGLEND
ncbi:TFIIB-type zinc ribbon-containing protein [Halomicrobium salinisoli]|uniref:TFIIB-type zinc ribbon-containing protein n=1 Tax=Halomicrobium salinisoli TaxID=2878391 RepID=UPI001CF0927B|nr:TFIIB-type zinc ribbon-containing protein [Halomicrobium salinisoli]